MFNINANTPCNNALFNRPTILCMADDYDRLLLAAKMLDPGITGKSSLGRFLNQSPQTINNWQKRGIPRAELADLSRKVGCTIDWLELGTPPMRASDSSSMPDEGQRFRPPSEVPVVGTTQGGPPDRIWEELQFPTGYSDEYLQVSTPDPHAYALRVVGSSMAPRIMEGEWLLVEPTGEAQPGDDVVVKTNDGRVMVKVLVSSHAGTLILSSINESFERITVQAHEVAFMHFVAGRFASRSVKRRVADTAPSRRIAQVSSALEEHGERRRSPLLEVPPDGTATPQASKRKGTSK